MSDFMEYAEYYKKAWEQSLKERTNELQDEIKTLRAENARYREALEWYATEYLKTDEELNADMSEINDCYETGNIAREALRGDITPEKGVKK